MKKIAKLSLVAAVAVAGFTSANATSLEEAIKGVDISGTAVYRYDDRSNAGYDQGNSYKVAVNLKSSINDDLTFNVRTIVGNATDMVSLKTDTADGNADISVSHANFAYTGLANTTVIAGKQAVPSPFAVQADASGDEDTGSGITAITAVGPVTVAATYLNQTNLGAVAAGQDIAGLGLMGNAGPVALDAWYLQAMETESANDDAVGLYTVGAKAKVEMVDLTARYSAADAAANGVDTESIWKIGAKAKLGIVTGSLDYGQSSDSDTFTGKGLITSLHGDADADVNLQAWALNLGNNDASLVKVSLGVDLLSNLNLSATYAAQEVGTADNDEYYGQLTYKMGKNFMTYARLGQVDMDGAAEEDTRGRLHVQYTF
jgi:ACT domain-containing protein